MDNVLLQILPELGSTALISGIFWLVVKRLIDSHNKQVEEYAEIIKSLISKHNHDGIT